MALLSSILNRFSDLPKSGNMYSVFFFSFSTQKGKTTEKSSSWKGCAYACIALVSFETATCRATRSGGWERWHPRFSRYQGNRHQNNSSKEAFLPRYTHLFIIYS